MVMVPPVDNADAVVNAKVVIPVVVFCANLSNEDIVITALLILYPKFGRNVPQLELLATSFDVEIDAHVINEYGFPICNCPAAKSIL